MCINGDYVILNKADGFYLVKKGVSKKVFGGEYIVSVAAVNNYIVGWVGNYICYITDYAIGEILFSNGNILTIVVGNWHKFVITGDGLYGFGHNDFGELGLKHNGDVGEFTRIDIEYDILTVKCGRAHTMILTMDGMVFGTGWNDDGQLGLGDLLSRNEFCYVRDKVLQLECNGDFSVILGCNNKVYGVGSNYYGQLGADDVNYCEFINIDINHVLSIECGYDFSVFLTNKGVYILGGKYPWSTDFNKPRLITLDQMNIRCDPNCSNIILYQNDQYYMYNTNDNNMVRIDSSILDTSKNPLLCILYFCGLHSLSYLFI